MSSTLSGDVARNPVCVSNTLFMSDNLPPVIGPPLTPGPESSTGSAHHSDGHAAAAPTSAADPAHATDDVNPKWHRYSDSVLVLVLVLRSRKPKKGGEKGLFLGSTQYIP